jgi:hypothetical protein
MKMKFFAAKGILFLFCASWYGCAYRHPAQKGWEWFVEAKVIISTNAPGSKGAAFSRTLTKQGDLGELLMYFPGVGQGNKSFSAASAIEVGHILLQTKPGGEIRISLQDDAWSEGEGDWYLSTNFWTFIRKIPDETPALSPL